MSTVTHSRAPLFGQGLDAPQVLIPVREEIKYTMSLREAESTFKLKQGRVRRKQWKEAGDENFFCIFTKRSEGGGWQIGGLGGVTGMDAEGN